MYRLTDPYFEYYLEPDVPASWLSEECPAECDDQSENLDFYCSEYYLEPDVPASWLSETCRPRLCPAASDDQSKNHKAESHGFDCDEIGDAYIDECDECGECDAYDYESGESEDADMYGQDQHVMSDADAAALVADCKKGFRSLRQEHGPVAEARQRPQRRGLGGGRGFSWSPARLAMRPSLSTRRRCCSSTWTSKQSDEGIVRPGMRGARKRTARGRLPAEAAVAEESLYPVNKRATFSTLSQIWMVACRQQ